MYGPGSIGIPGSFGGFPVNCPNGSGYSIRFGNDLSGTEAEGISYEFTIPANRNEYSLIYHYAVVFQDPNHQQYQQPRMEIEITNVTDNTIINCSSFTFIPMVLHCPVFLNHLPGLIVHRSGARTGRLFRSTWMAMQEKPSVYFLRQPIALSAGILDMLILM